jgi:hypothetical protein
VGRLMRHPSLFLLEPDRADKACLRAEAIRAILRVAERYAERYGIGEGLGVIQMALAIAEKSVELKPGQGNELLRDFRKSVDKTVNRLGNEATATDLALEFALLEG